MLYCSGMDLIDMSHSMCNNQVWLSVDILLMGWQFSLFQMVLNVYRVQSY